MHEPTQNRPPLYYLLCGVFGVSCEPHIWRWQLQVQDSEIHAAVSFRGREGKIRLGPPGPAKPTPSCFRAAALLALSTGDEATASSWAQAAGEPLPELRADLAALTTAHPGRLERIAAALRACQQVQWPGLLAGIMGLGERAHEIEGVRQLKIEDPAEITRLQAWKAGAACH